MEQMVRTSRMASLASVRQERRVASAAAILRVGATGEGRPGAKRRGAVQWIAGDSDG